MAVTWTVTGQLDQQYSYDGSGQPVLGHVVSFITGGGERSSVFIPEDKYTVANVTKAIHAKAAIVAAVSHLEFQG